MEANSIRITKKREDSISRVIRMICEGRLKREISLGSRSRIEEQSLAAESILRENLNFRVSLSFKHRGSQYSKLQISNINLFKNHNTAVYLQRDFLLLH